jgi:transcriptional regulator with XRE-family HTH domain
MRKLNLKSGDLAALANISAPTLSNFFKGRRELDAIKCKLLDQLLKEIEELKMFFPVPIGLHDPKLLALALHRFRTGRFESFRRLMSVIVWQPREDLKHLKKYHPMLFKKKEKHNG